MHTLTAWFTRNPVAANLLMLLLVIAGFLTVTGIRIEGFPALPPSSVTVNTVFPGASAEQVDRSLSRRIEHALEGMPGIKKIAAISTEGYSTVWVQKVSSYSLERFQNDIKTRVDAIPNLPQMAEHPLITRDEFSVSALLVQVHGSTDVQTLQQSARLIREELIVNPKISKMEIFGKRPYEIRIEVDVQKLETYGLSLTDIGRVVDQFSLDYRTGTLKSKTGKILLKADRKALHYKDFIHMPVRTLSDGTRLLLKDVATVTDGFEEEEIFARFQGQPSVGMLIYTTPKGHLIEVSEAAHDVVKSLKSQLPQEIQVDIWGDTSVYMKARLGLLQKNAWQGLLLVFLLLSLFLNLKLAFWVALGIPVSLAGALALMGERFLDYSLNDITTFGLIIVLGILVDDAVVVGESVFEERGNHGDPVKSTVRGVGKVATATVFGSLTTMAAFYPLLLIDNDLGKLFASFAVVVIVALLFSLIESKLILPAHLAAISVAQKQPRFIFGRLWVKIQGWMAWLLKIVNKRLYQPVLNHLLKHRYTSLLVFATLAVLGIGMIFKGQIRTVFFPEVPGDIITVRLKMHNGSPLSLTMSNVVAIEQAANDLNDEIMKELNLSEMPIARIMAASTDAYNAEIYAELQPEKNRAIGTMETLRRWRRKVGLLEGVEDLSFSGSFETGGGFIIEVTSRDETILREAVGELTAALKAMDAVHDVRDDLHGGEPQIRLRLKSEAQHLGLTIADLAKQIGDAYGGLEVQRLLRHSEEVKVIVRFQANRRRYIGDLLNAKIQTPDGRWLPLSLVASVESGYAPGAIYRRNGRRTVQIMASLDKSKVGAGEVFASIQEIIIPPLVAKYPAISIRGAGEIEEMDEMKGGLKKALVIILILIYALLAVPLKSYWQPLVIMSVVPFGFVGAVLGHKIAGIPLSVLSFFGMLALTGVVVNDSLVMLTFFNDRRKDGVPLHRALVQAGASRFRAIFLTTVTTVGGLMPLLSETSEQAQYLIPAAVSLAYGELFATPITLVLIPVLVHIAHDGRRLLAFFRPKIL